ncbi:MAG: DNA primase catalytic subunit PriS [Candidatus Thermoplasmatota archaeon]|nr:DNA primase catalytic subunit PriS [Candidatus Thermoplasmatota archaeon]
MNDFLKRKFQSYYTSPQISFPKRFSRREYAFLFFGGKQMIRHLSFKTRDEILTFLRRRGPSHVYYSSAYYERPDAPTMREKEWMGADLIFDLDADHLPGAERMRYEEMLRAVKDELKKLLSFLVDDFGFEEDNLSLYFSGGRGYHCHVTHPKVFHLRSQERREIVDHITGRGLDSKSIFRERVVETKKYGEKVIPLTRLEMPKPDEPGWRGRISRTIIGIVKEIREGERKESIDKLKSYGLSANKAERVIDSLSDARIKRIEEGLLDQSSEIKKFFLRSAIEKSAVSLSTGSPDEPVTADVKRLIRLPGSLHGKTGLKVQAVKMDEIDEFNPLNDAVVFGEDSIKIEITKPVNIKMKGENFNLPIGEAEVPEYLAVFLIGRGMATF